MGVKIIQLIGQRFKISNFVLGGMVIITSLYISLEGQRQREKQVEHVQGLVRVETR